MSRFKLNTQSDNIFIVDMSEMSERFDPDMIIYNRKASNYKYDTIKLGKLLKINPQYGANERGVKRFTETEPRYIRITDIENDGMLKEGLGKSAEVIEEQYFLNNKDVLIARSGNTVGKAYLHKKEKYNYECFFAGYMIRFILKKDLIIPEYFFIFTQSSFYHEWVSAIKRTAGQPNINAEEYKSLLIPLPPKEIQKKIVSLYDKAYNTKQQKETQAKELLASIDDYLLDELGIVLPEKDNSLERRMFTKTLNQLIGGRLDAEYSIEYYDNFYSSIEESTYPNISLRKTLTFLESGSRPKGGVGNIKDGIFSIGGEHVNKYCQVGNGKPKYIPKEFHEKNKLTETKLNDIVLVKDGATTGKIGIINSQDFVKQNINEHVFLLRTNDIVKTYYLVYFLHTLCGQIQLKREITGATVTGLTKEALNKIKIPIPPKEKQNEIVLHITALREKAKKLQEEAKQEMEIIKHNIETKILLN
jgi:restriction endonuclease S subunit